MRIMESILIFLVVSLMSSPVLGISQSMSCSMVNGKTICEKQTSDGNSAASFSGAAVGGGQTYQDAYAGAGDPGQWDFGRQTVFGFMPGANSGSPPPSGSPSGVYSSSSSSSSSSDFFPGQAGGFGFATGGGYPAQGGGYPAQGGGGYPAQGGGGYPAQGGGGYPAQGGAFAFGGGYPTQGGVAAGGFATGGGSPVGGGGFAFGGGYPAQGGAAAGGFATGGFFPFGGGNPGQAPARNPDSNQDQQQQGFDPFMFVRPFFGGGFPFGRR